MTLLESLEFIIQFNWKYHSMRNARYLLLRNWDSHPYYV